MMYAYCLSEGLLFCNLLVGYGQIGFLWDSDYLFLPVLSSGSQDFASSSGGPVLLPSDSFSRSLAWYQAPASCRASALPLQRSWGRIRKAHCKPPLKRCQEGFPGLAALLLSSILLYPDAKSCQMHWNMQAYAWAPSSKVQSQGPVPSLSLVAASAPWLKEWVCNVSDNDCVKDLHWTCTKHHQTIQKKLKDSQKNVQWMNCLQVWHFLIRAALIVALVADLRLVLPIPSTTFVRCWAEQHFVLQCSMSCPSLRLGHLAGCNWKGDWKDTITLPWAKGSQRSKL